MLSNTKAVSTLILIILLLCSMVFGAFLSYMWVVANFYLEPKNTGLVITEVNFPVDHGNYFYVTVMNPSHSPSKTNITSIYFTVEGDTKIYQVATTSPEPLPITLEIGASKTIKCDKSWGEFAGKKITVHVSASSASGAIASVSTPVVKIGLNLKFDASVSCRHFNVTITNNQQSAINLTLTKLYVNVVPIETAKRLPDGQNVTIFGIDLPIGQPVSLQCLYDWETLSNPKVRVETLEGYYAEATANATASVLLLITNVVFNEMKTDEVDVTVSNVKDSSTYVDITSIVFTYNNTQYTINGSLSSPLTPYRLLPNRTVTFNCTWSWIDYRDKNVTVTVYTRQGYTPISKTVKTPNEIVFKINAIFDLADTTHFLVNVTNMPCSLQNITVSQIKFNINQTSFAPQTIPISEWRVFNCTFDWTAFRRNTVTITVNASNTVVFQNVTLPYIVLNIINASFTTNESDKQFNVTIENINNSLLNATIARIIVQFGNESVFKSEGIGCIIEIGKNVTLSFSWNWSSYEDKEIAIKVYTTEGLEFIRTFVI